jgi:hypothetical protein
MKGIRQVVDRREMRAIVFPVLTILLGVSALTACVGSGPEGGAVAASRVNTGFATTFQKGDFVPDRRPLKPEDSRDLREMAMTMPIWEGDSEEFVQWVYESSSAAVDAETWTTPADGAQSAVRLRRLADSPGGAQRVALWIPPSLLDRYPRGMSWSSVLQRQAGGWLVESAGTIHQSPGVR